MAHKTLVDGTAYEVVGARPFVDGTAYSIKNGKALVDGTAYEISFPNRYTIAYYKIFGCEWASVYPPATNSGPVSKNGSEYYLRVTLGGNVLPGLGDYFTESGNVSPTRTITASEGTEIYIQLINKYDGNYCAVYVNDVKVAGSSEYCYYTLPLTSNMTMTFTWKTKNTLAYNPQSYWICNIYT